MSPPVPGLLMTTATSAARTRSTASRHGTGGSTTTSSVAVVASQLVAGCGVERTEQDEPCARRQLWSRQRPQQRDRRAVAVQRPGVDERGALVPTPAGVPRRSSNAGSNPLGSTSSRGAISGCRPTMRAAQLSVTVTMASARANARFSILRQQPCRRRRSTGCPPTDPASRPRAARRRFAAGSAANSADGGGHVAHTTSGRVRARCAPHGGAPGQRPQRVRRERLGLDPQSPVDGTRSARRPRS